MKRTFKIINKNEFLEVYKLMQDSFPPAEFRTYEDALSLFDCANYKVLVVKEDGVMQAFIAEWLMEDFCFVEHFAINTVARGQGLGTEIMREYLNQRKKAVVIEVEADDTSIAKRRIGFYEKLGFALSDVEYVQPLLQKTSTDVLLRLMHYPANLSHEALCEAKRLIFWTVYNKS